MLTLPDYRITASNFVREIFLSNEVTVPIAVQPYGHDLSWLKTYEGKSTSEVIRFGYIGQIIEAKGVHLLLQALDEIPVPLLDKFSLVIYGNLEHTPAYGQKIKDFAARFPNVSFGGTYSHADSARVFAEIDVLLVPSLWYDFPLIVHEAFATQAPVIATNLGGMAEVVLHEINGLLFERGNVQDLAFQMQRIVSEPGLLNKLQLGTPNVKSIQEEVTELEMIYSKVSNNIRN